MYIVKEILLSMFEFNQNKKKTHFPSITISMNVLYRNKKVYPQINKPFQCIDINSSKAIARLPLLCGYTPLVYVFIGHVTNLVGKKGYNVAKTDAHANVTASLNQTKVWLLCNASRHPPPIGQHS